MRMKNPTNPDTFHLEAHLFMHILSETDFYKIMAYHYSKWLPKFMSNATKFIAKISQNPKCSFSCRLSWI